MKLKMNMYARTVMYILGYNNNNYYFTFFRLRSWSMRVPMLFIHLYIVHYGCDEDSMAVSQPDFLGRVTVTRRGATRTPRVRKIITFAYMLSALRAKNVANLGKK